MKFSQIYLYIQKFDIGKKEREDEGVEVREQNQRV